MSNLVVVTFEEEATAFEIRAELVKMQKEYLIEMEDVVVVTKDEKGKTKLHQAVNLTAAGAVGGSFWGMLIGVLFLNPLLGMAAGAGAGAISGAMSDIGINNQTMKEMAESFNSGGSAIFVLIRSSNREKVLERLKPFSGKGKVFQTSLSKDREDALREVLEKNQIE